MGRQELSTMNNNILPRDMETQHARTNHTKYYAPLLGPSDKASHPFQPSYIMIYLGPPEITSNQLSATPCGA